MKNSFTIVTQENVSILPGIWDKFSLIPVIIEEFKITEKIS
jgi:hypothetical protein